MPLRTPRAWRRARRTLVGLAVAGLMIILIGPPLVGQCLFGCGLLGLLLLEASLVRRAIQESRRQQYAHIQIRPLMGDMPLDLSGWAADPLLVHNAVKVMLEVRPNLVLECGSGSSTVMLARCLQGLGTGRIISLEHDAECARRTGDLLHQRGLERVATVVCSSLIEREVNGHLFRWYSQEYERLIDRPIDVLVVDGPPGRSGPRARYPAVPLLKTHLASRCWILLDDGDRPDEEATARLWAIELDANLSYLEGGRGGWLLRRQPDPGGDQGKF